MQDLVGHLGSFVYLRFLILSVYLYKLYQTHWYAKFQALSDKALLKLNANVQKRPVSLSRSLMGWIGNDYMHCSRTPHFKNQIQNILMVFGWHLTLVKTNQLYKHLHLKPDAYQQYTTNPLNLHEQKVTLNWKTSDLRCITSHFSSRYQTHLLPAIKSIFACQICIQCFPFHFIFLLEGCNLVIYILVG